eukprot:Sdes_comp17995_c0_seq1m7257
MPNFLCSVAFKGDLGSCVEEVALDFIYNASCRSIRDEYFIDTLDCKDYHEVFSLVDSGKADYGFVAIEDWGKGTVTATLDLLMFHNVTIEAEVISKRDLVLVELGYTYTHFKERSLSLSDMNFRASHSSP